MLHISQPRRIRVTHEWMARIYATKSRPEDNRRYSHDLFTQSGFANTRPSERSVTAAWIVIADASPILLVRLLGVRSDR